MINIIVTGAGGRMGARIIQLIRESTDLNLVGALEKEGHPTVGKDVGEVIGLGKIGLVVSDNLESLMDLGEVIIDFTFHSASMEHLRQAAPKKKPMVIGSTGFTALEMEEIKGMAQSVPLVVAPNMSVGVNVLFKVVRDVAQTLGEGFDIEILEVHHKMKKDAPSGTAMKLAQVLAQARSQNLDEVAVYERKGIIGERKPEEIGIQTFRAGDIIGEHTVLFGGMGERLEITHRAHNRDTFARGALRAARWIVQQKNGLFDMQDVLGLK
ncbi:MAG TPA: 4-hydroxy-tetrahydrodipicolinate reductase [Thermodesulfobacteriota bacterium]|nr:4-hydroxy-tetrahydrodipicolinate reductase [Thermodesulfobacteriota bacterium]